MKTAKKDVWRVRYKDGIVGEHPGDASEDEIRAHCVRMDGEIMGKFTVEFTYPDEREVAIKTLRSLDFEVTDELVEMYLRFLDRPDELRKALMRWREAHQCLE